MAGERFGLSPQTTQISTGDPRTVNEPERFQESPGLPGSISPGVLGAIVRFEGNLYRYVLHDQGSGAVAVTVGGVAYFSALDPETSLYTVTSDQTDSIGGINAVAGIYGVVVDNGNFCYVQVGGVVTANTAASTVAGDKCIGSTTDLTFGRIAAGVAPTDNVYGTAISARVSNQNSVILQGLDW